MKRSASNTTTGRLLPLQQAGQTPDSEDGGPDDVRPGKFGDRTSPPYTPLVPGVPRMTTRTATKPSYSVAQANRTLPLVRSIAMDIVAEFGRLREIGRERRALEVTAARDADARKHADDLKHDLDDGAQRIDGFIKELSELGCELKDPERGLIDFPSERAGRNVWLCWKLGDDAVANWHALDETYADRRPVDAACKRERRPAEGERRPSEGSSE
jgi:hypothetical protein